MMAITTLLLPSSLAAQVSIVLLTIYWVYRRACPKPLNGIPYNKEAENWPMGDISLGPQKEAPREALGKLGTRHNAPLVQIFMGPFTKPTLVLFDYWEAQEICLRRNHEFDKSTRNSDVFGLIIPHNHGAMKTSEPGFRENKELTKDLMSPSFLNKVSGPGVYRKAASLVKLWALKTQQAHGRPFSALDDLDDFTFDSTTSSSFGQGDDESILVAHIAHTLGAKPTIPDSIDEPAIFTRAPLRPEYQAIRAVVASSAAAIPAPFPKFAMWSMKKFTPLGKDYDLKDKFLHEMVENAARKASATQSDDKVGSALDHLILREVQMAKKAGREPYIHNPKIIDELMGYIFGGFESSSSALGWLCKYLTDMPEHTNTLRAHLHAVFKDAYDEKRLPTPTEIAKTKTPYLDAWQEEAFRYMPATPITMRETTVDTHILGHFVPKGCTVLCWNHGPSVMDSPFVIKDRSEASRDHMQRIPYWAETDAAKFEPRRWLRRVDGGMDGSFSFDNYEFDPKAGPTMSFGAGTRGCSGRRLAYLAIRTFLILTVWSFEFEPSPESLNIYHPNYQVTTPPKACYLRLREVLY